MKQKKLSRRSYLQFTGGLVATVGHAVSVAGATEDYETVRVPPNSQRIYTLGDGDRFEKKVIDITALNADAQIRAHGSNWEIKDVGFRGAADKSGPHPPGKNAGGFANLISASGTGVIEHVYLGDGVAGDLIRKGAIGVERSHTGHLQVKGVNMSEWSGNAVYAGGAAATGKPNGTIAVDQCLLRDNNISHLRIATDGSSITNSVIYNTNSVPVHPLSDGIVNSRGIYDGYGTKDSTITIEGCHIDCTNRNTNGGASALAATDTVFAVKDSQIKGEILGNVETENVGSKPHHQAPADVPSSAVQAAAGKNSTKTPTEEIEMPKERLTKQRFESENKKKKQSKEQNKNALQFPSEIAMGSALFSSFAVGVYSKYIESDRD